MPLLEEELESLLQGKDTITLNDTKIKITGRQVSIGTYFIDLIGVDTDGEIYIIELKRGEVDGNALAQVLNYMHMVEEFTGTYVNGILVGKKLSGHMQLAMNMVDDVSFLKFDLDVELKKEEWHLTDDFFEKEHVKFQGKNLYSILDLPTEHEIENLEVSKLEKEEDE